MLLIDNLSVKYSSGKRGSKKAVDSLSFAVKKGEIYGFLGPNGAGKTTTIKTILGIINPSSGRVLILDKPVSREIRSRVGYMPEIANYYWYLTPEELLAFYGSVFGIPKQRLGAKISELLDMAGLINNRGQLMKTFSKGMLQKVSFAQALINDPEFLILDEPTTGLDPIAKMNMRDTLIRLKKTGKTIFFSSHELSEVELICDRVAIIKNGRLLRETPPKSIYDEKGAHISLEQHFFDLVRNQ